MLKIIFVRHAESVGDKLTCRGKRQAKSVCSDLWYENITKVYVSPLNRTIATAKIIAKKLGLENVVYDKRITERDTDKSKLSQKQVAEYDANYLNPEYSHTKPEGCKQFLTRVFSFLDNVIKANDDGTDKSILVVGHSSLSYAMYAYFYGVQAGTDLVWTRVGNACKLCFQNVSKESKNA
ncbi:MAG: histidine phosphatase family protein [Clostridia bacterium]|nr:histidine phosphatase family protein [Clostridia bacterium]